MTPLLLLAIGIIYAVYPEAGGYAKAVFVAGVCWAMVWDIAFFATRRR